jgi:hypothetical protein
MGVPKRQWRSWRDLRYLELAKGVERLNFELVQDEHTEDVVSSEHGHSKFCSNGFDIAQRVFVFRVSLQVRDMDRSAVKRHPCVDGVPSRRDGMASDKLDQLFGGVVESDPVVGVAVSSKDDSSVGLAQSRCSLDEVIQHHLQVKGRAADYLEHVR